MIVYKHTQKNVTVLAIKYQTPLSGPKLMTAASLLIKILSSVKSFLYIEIPRSLVSGYKPIFLTWSI